MMRPLGMQSWHDYDEALIERGCAILDLGSLTSWREELDAMNREKLGRPFEFPNSYISFLAFAKVGFDTPYRTLEGIVRELSEYVRFVEGQTGYYYAMGSAEQLFDRHNRFLIGLAPLI